MKINKISFGGRVFVGSKFVGLDVYVFKIDEIVIVSIFKIPKFLDNILTYTIKKVSKDGKIYISQTMKGKDVLILY